MLPNIRNKSINFHMTTVNTKPTTITKSFWTKLFFLWESPENRLNTVSVELKIGWESAGWGNGPLPVFSLESKYYANLCCHCSKRQRRFQQVRDLITPWKTLNDVECEWGIGKGRCENPNERSAERGLSPKEDKIISEGRKAETSPKECIYSKRVRFYKYQMIY